MVDYADDYKYAHNRLRDSLILYKGQPKVVVEVKKNGTVLMSDLVGGDWVEGEMKDINNSDIPLGFINYKGYANYLVRLPKKQYRQGITPGVVQNITKKANFNPFVPEICKTILNSYPSISDSIERLECGEAYSCAFHRNYAIGAKLVGGKYLLMYKQFQVGTIFQTYGNINIDLSKDFYFLQEDVMEEIYAQLWG